MSVGLNMLFSGGLAVKVRSVSPSPISFGLSSLCVWIVCLSDFFFAGLPSTSGSEVIVARSHR